MSDDFGDNPEVEYDSYCGKMCDAFCMAVLGLCCVPFAIIIIFINEKQAVCTEKAYVDAKRQTTETACVYNAGNNGEQIHFTCDVDSTARASMALKEISSDLYSGDVQGPNQSWKISVKKEFYTWKETKKTHKEKDKVGGGTTTVTCYKWTKGWTTSPKDPRKLNFDHPCSGERPPSSYDEDYASNIYGQEWDRVKDGKSSKNLLNLALYKSGSAQNLASQGFELDENDIGKIDGATSLSTVTMPTGSVGASWYKKGNELHFKPGSGRGSTSSAQPGDIKLTITAMGGAQISAVAVQEPGTTVPVTTGKIKEGKFGGFWLCGEEPVFDIEADKLTADEMYDKLSAELAALVWFLRIFCLFLLWAAFYCIMSPLTVAPDIIPCIGEFISDIVSCAVCCAACAMACMCWIIWTGIFFAMYRPHIGIPMVLIGCCIIGGFMYKKMNKEESDADDDAETPDDGGAEMAQTQQPVEEAPAPEPETGGGDELPDGWVAKLDPASGATYYCFEATGVTQWEKPS